MFRHHKHCVIEATGILIALDDAGGDLQLYLLDEPVASGNRDGSSIGRENAIRIADPALLAFVRQHGSPGSDPGCRYRLQARITGNVNMDGGETYLTEVTAAVMLDGNRTLTYALAD
jgi:hypothetical protein